MVIHTNHPSSTSSSRIRFATPPSSLLQQSGRNDVPFFAGVVLLFALPPAVLLFWAFSSGYIEEIDRYGLLRW